MPRSVFLSLATATLAVLLVLSYVTLTYLRPDDSMPSGVPVRRGPHPLMLVLAAVAPGLLLVGAILLLRGLSRGGLDPAAAGAFGGVTLPEAKPAGPDDVFLPIAAFAAALLVTWMLAARLRARPVAAVGVRLPAAPADAAIAMTEVLDDGLDALLAERDPRRAVVIAYARMERAMARRGWARRPTEAPTEYVARVLSSVPLHGPEVARLSELYVLARFSDRAIEPAMRDEAITLVRSLRAGAEPPVSSSSSVGPDETVTRTARIDPDEG